MTVREGVPRRRDWVSLHDVAREAGVSSRTVARVMSDRDKVAIATAERVDAVAARLGYKGNDLARSLKAARSMTLGLVIPDIANPFFAACCKSIELTARQHGYGIMLCDSDAKTALQAEYVDLLVRRRVDGLIVAPVPGADASLAPDQVHHIPVVTLDRPADGTAVNVVVTNSKGTLDATNHLIVHGHRRIAFIGQTSTVYTTKTRLDGFRKAMRLASLSPSMVRLDARTVEDAGRELRGLLEADPTLTAVVAGNSVISAGVLHEASLLGLRVPEQLAVIGFDDFDLLGVLSPTLATVRQPTQEIGRIATQAILDRLTGQPPGPRRVVLRTSFHPGPTCGCDPKPKLADA